MKLISVVVLLILCQPLSAEDTAKFDPFANQIVTLKVQYGSDGIRGFFESQIFNMEVWHQEWTKQITMDWALLSPGAESMDDNNWLGILVEYPEPPAGNPMNLMGWERKCPNMYLNLHHKDQTWEAHFYYPLIAHTEDRSLYPWLEVERLRVYDVNTEIQIYLRGSAGLHRDIECSIGLRYRKGPYEAKIDSSGAWSISFSSSSSIDF